MSFQSPVFITVNAALLRQQVGQFLAFLKAALWLPKEPDTALSKRDVLTRPISPPAPVFPATAHPTILVQDGQAVRRHLNNRQERAGLRSWIRTMRDVHPDAGPLAGQGPACEQILPDTGMGRLVPGTAWRRNSGEAPDRPYREPSVKSTVTVTTYRAADVKARWQEIEDKKRRAL
ncbi:hypothetical protein [Arthrobacter mobilis]|uniref:Uncharacterized protein n=1 Tax=Arthrobacter mobilis TaxID=2724944 RepID=A0A7X6HHP2_9MICC|nr:hypothetical protein [Arthrobacter mobilis]NKX55937.1 hypothetical protein [Arthrobacter mobilis]